MVAVEDVLTESLTATIRDWFEPTFSHPFINIKIISVPDAVKTIPHRWVDDVQIDDLFRGEDGDIAALGNSASTWCASDGHQKLQQALARLDLHEDHLPHIHSNIERMSRHDFGIEKRAVKQELKRYDSEFRKQFSRLPTHTEKEPMRPLYVYYRRLKTVISQAEQSKMGRNSRAGVIGGGDDMALRFEGLTTIPDLDETPRSGNDKKGQDTEDQIAALEVRIESKQQEKAAVRAKLQAFQEKFVSEHSRKIHFHKDILPIEREYRMYKNLKEDIMKSEVQLRNLRAEV